MHLAPFLVRLLFVLLLLHAVLSFPELRKKKKDKTKHESRSIKFRGAVIGGSNEFEVQIGYQLSKWEVQKSSTKAPDGAFSFSLTLKDTQTQLQVIVESKGKLGGMTRRKLWTIECPEEQKYYMFFMGEFEPNNRVLFLRGLFTNELPGGNAAYLLRLTSEDGATIYGAAEISGEQRTNWSDPEEGAIVQLNSDGVAYVQSVAAPQMVLRLDATDKTSAECTICKCVLNEGVEAMRELFNCQHSFHESCIVNSINKTMETRRNRFQCPNCHERIAFIRQTTQRTRDKSPWDVDGSAQRDAEIFTRELDAEGNVVEKLVEYTTGEVLEKVRKQSQTTGQMTDDFGFVYFKEKSETLTEMFAFSLAQPVFQNGSGGPKFVYHFETSYRRSDAPTKMIFKQTMKTVADLDTIKNMERDVLVGADFVDLTAENDANDGQIPPLDGGDAAEDDPDWFAVREIPDVDVPPSPPDSDEIAAGLRPIGPTKERSNFAAEHSGNYVPNLAEKAQRFAAEQQAKILDQIQRQRHKSADNRTAFGDSPIASPARNWWHNSNTQTKGTRNDGISPRRHKGPFPTAGDNGVGDDDDDMQLWELLAQSTRSSWTEEQSAERAADEAQLSQMLRQQRTEGGWASSPAKSTPGRRGPAPIPRPNVSKKIAKRNI